MIALILSRLVVVRLHHVIVQEENVSEQLFALDARDAFRRRVFLLFVGATAAYRRLVQRFHHDFGSLGLNMRVLCCRRRRSIVPHRCCCTRCRRRVRVVKVVAVQIDGRFRTEKQFVTFAYFAGCLVINLKNSYMPV